MIGFFLSAYLIAVVPDAPRIEHKPTHDFMRKISDNIGRVKILTSDPNGLVNGRYGQLAGYYDGVDYWICMCISSPSGMVWKKVKLT